MLSYPHSCQKGLICRFWLKVVEWKFQNSLKESWNPKKCVVLSWASFWMKLSIAPARVGLGITSYLSIKTLANSFQDGMPRVAYLKVSFSIILSGRLCLGRAVPKNIFYSANLLSKHPALIPIYLAAHFGRHVTQLDRPYPRLWTSGWSVVIHSSSLLSLNTQWRNTSWERIRAFQNVTDVFAIKCHIIYQVVVFYIMPDVTRVA